MQGWGDDFQFLIRIMGMDMKLIVTPRNEAFWGRVRAESDTKEIQGTHNLSFRNLC